ncbi:serine/threonine protein kinase [Arthrobacter sp. zg-Y916]|uniref:non-specific serine/threonine protein kinase n=1 Tax=Arthrobacter caoxuetaonis TaxID=2886935 RepID=A0A9X1ME92_9MICC|nr:MULTISPECIES: serine/threonine-protein kinase [Arthrobacter]MCC3297184.1 serine/threonine protein kinase [Arthrobacter caoxuetaonis]MCC9194073.1 serine/threonine protein kinase [Arthrobacter sp. zg-Y916]USQ58256.1 serine/threonine protein kinase [Arthrobacter caoxuetaonis]
MTKRPPAPPPGIPGFRFLEHLGSGGFADVYLYEQDRPRRRVAVKVLLSDLREDTSRASFEAEANLMAQLSSHPYIVTIYEADTTADGRSYLAMEYCSRPSLDARYRQGGLPLAEVLAVGIQVASAVETAHRAGIAHRDIKPGNILTTDYNRPALTDFGISGTMDAEDEGHVGMSIPWSPPEALAGARVDGIRADIYALGATLYTLLAGRSPFVRPGHGNTQRDLVDRIISEPLRPTGRADVPESLELALATAMAKSPESRYSSAYAFALALQRTQAELNLAVTEFAVLEDAGRQKADEEDDGERTRVRQIVSIDPSATTFPPTLRAGHRLLPRGPHGGPDSDTGQDTGQEGTVLRERRPAPAAAAEAPAPGEFPATPVGVKESLHHTDSGKGNEPGAVPDGTPARRRLLTGIGAAVVLAVVLLALLLPPDSPRREAAPAPTQPPSNALGGLDGAVAPPAALSGTQEAGEAVFTWTNPEPQDGDIYLWRTVTATSRGELVRTAETEAVLPSGGVQTCIEVQVARANGRASEPAAACTQ